jgi:hypothetical protein
MTLDELIERLEDIREEVGGGLPVRGAFQPNYVLLADVLAVTAVVESGDEDGLFIALGDGREYGSQEHYADEVIVLREEDEDEEEEDA